MTLARDLVTTYIARETAYCECRAGKARLADWTLRTNRELPACKA